MISPGRSWNHRWHIGYSSVDNGSSTIGTATWGVWSSGGEDGRLSVAIRLSPDDGHLGCARELQDSGPIAKGIDRGNCPEGAESLPLRSRRCGRSLTTTSVASAPTSPLGRLISRSCFRGNALAGARTADLGDHRRFSTNSFSVPAEILSVCGAVSAAMAGRRLKGRSRCRTSR